MENIKNIVKAKIDTMFNEGSTKALATVTIADSFAVHGVRIIKGHNGYFISMPQRQYKDGDETKYTDICNPVTKLMRETINEAVLEAFKAKMLEI